MSLEGEPGDAITLSEVLMIGDGEGTKVGAPFVSGASVAATIVEHARGPKVIAFKKRRRKNSKRKRGHRQDLTVLRVTGITTGA
jgi:large subunit ribosomal protein L21